MTITVFILGRPGSGKSAASQQIAATAWSRGWFALRCRDYEILMRMFLSDTQGKFQATEHGGFDVLDFSVLDIALNDLVERSKAYLPLQKGHMLLIEFARNDYAEALKLFDHDLLQDAYFLFIETDVDTCINRIRERVAHPLTADDFFVSEDMLRGYYGQEISVSITSDLKRDFGNTKKVEIIDNMGSEQDFLEKVRRFAEQVFEARI